MATMTPASVSALGSSCRESLLLRTAPPPAQALQWRYPSCRTALVVHMVPSVQFMCFDPNLVLVPCSIG